jgi:hypothetical protein
MNHFLDSSAKTARKYRSNGECSGAAVTRGTDDVLRVITDDAHMEHA